MRYRHTKRSGFLFILLNIVTVSIFGAFSLNAVGKEIDSLYAEEEGYKKGKSFFLCYLLGFVTLGIVPLIWCARASDKVGKLAKQRGIEKPTTTYVSMVLGIIPFSLIIIGPFVSFIRFFGVLNRLERLANEEKDKEAEEAAKATIIDSPEEEKPAEEESFKIQTPSCEASKDQDGREGYTPEEEPKKRQWRVRYSDSGKVAAYFDNKEDAVAFARKLTLAQKKQGKVIVHVRKD